MIEPAIDPRPQTTSRLQSIDFLRGLVIILMTVDHVREFFYFTVPLPDPMELAKVDLGTFSSRILAHFCAPTFVFLTGLSAWLLADRRNLNRRQLTWFLCQRGALFMLLEVTLINFAWTFTFPPEKVFLQVIWAIGFSMLSLAGLIWLPWYVQLTIALTIICGHNLLDAVEFAKGSPLNWAWALLHDRQTLEVGPLKIRTSYPVLPWIGIMLLGFVAGRWFRQSQPNNWLCWAGVSLFATFVVLRLTCGYGEPSVWQASVDQSGLAIMDFFNLTKYPPSLLFSLMTLGPALFILWAADIPGEGGWLYRTVTTFGRVSFLYYVLHLYFLHLAYRLSGLCFGYSWNETPLRPDMPQKLDVGSIWAVWLIAALTLISLFPIVAAIARLKRQGRFPILRYL